MNDRVRRLCAGCVCAVDEFGRCKSTKQIKERGFFFLDRRNTIHEMWQKILAIEVKGRRMLACLW